ncbi:MAG: hypothetical protein K9K65_12775 [Desulfarculaceae bacterium]|nr:hypothetical protein [Desulfarculaceae bacterium]MCF8047070.1 hypothetical protein [Desulfarculaceae bacterium]MCF8065232.1 hypothetical protein [Desulfarculaceae bacterium]MCF8098706.1 hypothetical protein [Desulfarculaceae bacterium]MCF8123936.1 hypothetical protein [Desulfarculaceae bacterium]
MKEQLTQLAEAMRQEIKDIPQTMLQETVVRQALVCLLYQAVKEMGLIPLAGWKPPRSTREGIDLVGVDNSGELPRVQIAFVIDPLVELHRLKALEWVDCEDKIVVSFSERTDKIQQSSFFLTKAHTHLSLY